MFPTPTQGDGSVRPAYRKMTDGQGRSVSTRRVGCGICGFPGADTNKHDHSGGSLDGSGAGGTISLQSDGSGAQSDADGNQTYRSGGGCPLCFSKAFTGVRRYDEFMSSRPVDVLR